MKINAKLEKLIKSKACINLDVGCGDHKTDPSFLGMDLRPGPGIDIVHNAEKFPWPIPDSTCAIVHAGHLIEHIRPTGTDPKLKGLIDLLLDRGLVKKKDVAEYIGDYDVFSNLIRFMDEVWRVTQPGGKFHFVVPYGVSDGFLQDPTHIKPITETTLAYFDPEHPSKMWYFYKPKPWKVEVSAWQSHGFLEVLLKKVDVIPE